MAFNPIPKYSGSAVKRYPLKASETVSQGDVITLLRSTGIAQKCAGTAGETFLGFATESVDAAAWTAAGATSGNISIQVYNGGQTVREIAVTGSGSTGILAAADIGKTVFATDEDTLTVLGGNVPIGIVVPIATGDVILTTGGYGAGKLPATTHYAGVQLFEPTVSPNGVPFLVQFPFAATSFADGDMVTDFPLGAAVGGSFVITGFYAVTTTTLTDGGKTTTLNLEIGTTNLTGGVLVLSVAASAAIGTVTASTAITGNNAGTASSVVSVEASSTTGFTGGAATLYVTGYKTGV
jgi:hypothetical protein